MSRLTLTCPAGPSDTGAYRLEWKGGKAPYRLEENGTLLYAGPQGATTVSGRSKGDYTYRVASAHGETHAWSNSCSVAVRPPSMTLALTLFGIGLFVFLATVIVVVRGHRAHRRGQIA